MNLEPPPMPARMSADPALQVYLLGSVDFEDALRLQRRLVFEVAGLRRSAALILCEHPPLITVGRQGSRSHILCEPNELRARQWRVRWVNRGGGSFLHLPGQLAAYPILALDQQRLGLADYLLSLQGLVGDLLDDFGIKGENSFGHEAVSVAGRPIAALGVAVRDWVSYFGVYFNTNPALDLFRIVRLGGRSAGPMTSLARERRAPLRASLVRERFVEHFARRFGFERTALFSSHPSLDRRAFLDALATYS